MAGTARSQLSLLPDEENRPASARAKDWLEPVALAIGLIALLVAIVTGLWSQRHDLRTLPDEQRVALFSRAVDELRQFCGEDRPAALDGHCREQASFAAQFDECRGECRTLVQPLLAPRPTR